MALQIAVPHRSWSNLNPNGASFDQSRCCLSRGTALKRVDLIGSSSCNGGGFVNAWRRRRESVRVRANLKTVGEEEALVGKVTEVDKDTFWPIVESSAGKIVVLDMYTQWCGPCKVMAPKLQELAEKYLDVVFLKLDCNKENKALAMELGIRVVPTFKILKESKIVKEVTGAKLDDLVAAIETARAS